jgi:hypothetical protein
VLILALALINYLLVYYLPSVATREGGASEDSGAEKSMFVSLCADGDDENSVWWMLVKRSVSCFAWRHFDSPTRVIDKK